MILWPQFETATYREGHGEVQQSHTSELDGMKLAAKIFDRQTLRSAYHASLKSIKTELAS